MEDYVMDVDNMGSSLAAVTSEQQPST